MTFSKALDVCFAMLLGVFGALILVHFLSR